MLTIKFKGIRGLSFLTCITAAIKELVDFKVSLSVYFSIKAVQLHDTTFTHCAISKHIIIKQCDHYMNSILLLSFHHVILKSNVLI